MSKEIISRGNPFEIEHVDREFGGARKMALRVDDESGVAEINEPKLGAAGARRTCVISFDADDFADLANGVKTLTKDLGASLPAGARLLGVSVAETWTGFDDPAHGTYGIEIGTGGDADAVRTSVDVAAGASGLPASGTAGVIGYDCASLGGLQLKVKLTSNKDLNTVTAGQVRVDLFYITVG